MAEDWAAIAAEVTAALQEVGATSASETVHIRRITKTGPDYDPVFNSDDYPCTLVQMTIDLTKATGTLIEATDRMAMISSSDLPIVPTTADVIVIGTREHAIKSIQPLQPDPGSVALVYEVVFVA